MNLIHSRIHYLNCSIKSNLVAHIWTSKSNLFYVIYCPDGTARHSQFTIHDQTEIIQHIRLIKWNETICDPVARDESFDIWNDTDGSDGGRSCRCIAQCAGQYSTSFRPCTLYTNIASSAASRRFQMEKNFRSWWRLSRQSFCYSYVV